MTKATSAYQSVVWVQCEHLFCQCEAVARLTAPHLKPRHFVCEDHLREMLEWARPYRHSGIVRIEPTDPSRASVLCKTSEK
jgi:hypothetical protein